MFTGIVETMGTVLAAENMDTTTSGGGGTSFTIGNASLVLEDVHLGDSIACNGVCLTVTEFDNQKTQFKVGVSPETLRKTNMNDLKVGDAINLERAMSGSTRFGGHFVQGHVDTTCIIEGITPDPPNSVIVKFHIPPSEHLSEPFLYIVPKGYITLDGTSLTVIDTDVEKRTFSIMMIPYTRQHVTLGKRQVGERVNIEVDVLGKYVERVAKSMLFTGEGGDSKVGTMLSKFIDDLIEKKLNDRMK